MNNRIEKETSYTVEDTGAFAQKNNFSVKPCRFNNLCRSGYIMRDNEFFCGKTKEKYETTYMGGEKISLGFEKDLEEKTGKA